MANVKPDTAPDAVFAGWLWPDQDRRQQRGDRSIRLGDRVAQNCPEPAPAPGRRGAQPPGQRRPRRHEWRRSRAPTPSMCAPGRRPRAERWPGWRRVGKPGARTFRALRARGQRHQASFAADGRGRSDRRHRQAAGLASIRSVIDPAMRNPISAQRQADTAICRKPTTGAVKERLVYAPHASPSFGQESDPIDAGTGITPKASCERPQ